MASRKKTPKKEPITTGAEFPYPVKKVVNEANLQAIRSKQQRVPKKERDFISTAPLGSKAADDMEKKLERMLMPTPYQLFLDELDPKLRVAIEPRVETVRVWLSERVTTGFRLLSRARELLKKLEA